MKTTLHFLFGILIAACRFAEFRTWTSKDGKTAELELVSVVEADGEKSGEFKMRNGQNRSRSRLDLSAKPTPSCWMNGNLLPRPNRAASRAHSTKSSTATW